MAEEQRKVVPFGKYKGQPYEVLQHDPSYVEWMRGQDWVQQRYPTFHTLIINNFQEPTETPEHNALQALFLEEAFQRRVLWTWINQKPGLVARLQQLMTESPHQKRLQTRVQFEATGRERRAIDVLLTGLLQDWRMPRRDEISPYVSGKVYPEEWWHLWSRSLEIEIKPSLGDDYPAVLRHVQPRLWNDWEGLTTVVLIRDFTAQVVTIDQVRKIFALSGVLLLTFHEVEREGMNALM